MRCCNWYFLSHFFEVLIITINDQTINPISHEIVDPLHQITVNTASPPVSAVLLSCITQWWYWLYGEYDWRKQSGVRCCQDYSWRIMLLCGINIHMCPSSCSGWGWTGNKTSLQGIMEVLNMVETQKEQIGLNVYKTYQVRFMWRRFVVWRQCEC